MSFVILIFFMIEVFLKIFVFRLEFFYYKFEILDVVVVVVFFVFDIVFIFREYEFEVFGLLILFRLWRVVRIINGMFFVFWGVEGMGERVAFGMGIEVRGCGFRFSFFRLVVERVVEFNLGFIVIVMVINMCFGRGIFFFSV